MIYGINVLLIIKYAAAIAIVIGIRLAPAYLARVSGRDKYNMLLVRIYSWLFGWTGIGWLIALFWGIKK